MPEPAALDPLLLEQLSALADGESDSASAAAACAAWDRESSARACWHAYQLIGDVLRSQDLAADPARDAALLHGIRARLAGETAAVTQSLPDPTDVRRRRVVGSAFTPVGSRLRAWVGAWGLPSALGAALAGLVAGVVLTRPAAPVPESIARNSGADVAPLAAGTTERVAADASGPRLASAAPDPLPAPGFIVRDPRLDAYLAAHKQFVGSSALGVPSAFLRSATVESTAP